MVIICVTVMTKTSQLKKIEGQASNTYASGIVHFDKWAPQPDTI